MRKRISKIFGFVVWLATLAGCSSDGCFKFAGSDTVVVQSIDSLKVINIYGVFEVELIEDSVNYAEVYAKEQPLKNVELEENADTLECYYYNGCFWRRGYDRPELKIHFTDISYVNIIETSLVYSSDTLHDSFDVSVRADVGDIDLIVNCSRFFIYTNQSSGGHFKYRGKVENAYLHSYNTGYFDMSELECTKAIVKNYSTVDMEVNVTDYLELEIYNTGNVIYKGNPEIVIDTLASTGQPVSWAE